MKKILITVEVEEEGLFDDIRMVSECLKDIEAMAMAEVNNLEDILDRSFLNKIWYLVSITERFQGFLHVVRDAIVELENLK